MPDETPITGPPVKLPIPVCRTQSQIGSLRKSAGDAMPTMEGHFSVFDDWYEINSYFEGEFMERIAPGAFKKTFKDDASRKNAGDKIKCILEHGHDYTVGDKPLGVPRSLSEDATGAAYEVPLLDTSYVRDLVPALDAGAYGASFRFRVLVDEWIEEPERSDYNPGGIPERTIKEVRVMEFGPTMFPASAGASAGLRSTTDDYYAAVRARQPEQFEEAMRSARETRSAAAPAPVDKVREGIEHAQAAAVRTIPDAPETVPADTVEPVRSEDADTAGDRVSYADGDQSLSTPEEAAPEATDQRTQSTTSTPAAKPGAAPRTTTEPSTTHSAGNHIPQDTQRSAPVPADDLTMTVEERTQRQAEIRTRLAEMDAEYNGSVLPDEQQEEWDRISAEFDTHTVAVRAATARANRIATLAGDGNTEDGTPFHAPNVIARKSAENVYDLTALRRDARNMGDLARSMRDNALRAVELNHYDSVDDESATRAHIERLLRRVDDSEGTLARSILQTGSPMYDRAFGKAALAGSMNGLNNEERAALAVGVTTTGGFAVPFSLDPTVIMTNASVVNPIRQISRVVQIAGKQWQGVTSAGISVARGAEAAEASDNSPTIAQPTVTPTRVQGFVPFSFEVDQDWAQMRSELAMMFDEAKNVEEATAFITGTGVDPQPEGVQTGVFAVGASVLTTGTTLTFVQDDIYVPVNDLPPRHVANASWLAPKSFYNKVRTLDTQGGAALWARIGDGRPARLVDYPVYEASTMSAFSTTVGTKLAILGDFNKFLIVDRIGMSVELIPHLFGTANNFPTGQRGMYAVWRNSSKVLDPNAFRLLKAK
jgi:HK97 family phage major capsid protein/HK97 family phage prohead protease